jgi:uncharacterized protein with GYD domain
MRASVRRRDRSGVHNRTPGARTELLEGKTNALRGDRMSTFVLMTKLSPDITRDMKKRETIGREWKEQVDRTCKGIRWINHYALLGPYDFMDVFEAPNEEVAAKVSMISLARGAVQAESWTAIPYTRFVELTKEI